MLKSIMSLSFLVLPTVSFASQLPGAPVPAPVKSEYQSCRDLEAKGIIPFVPCYLLKTEEEKLADLAIATAKANYEDCLELEADGIIPFVSCETLKTIWVNLENASTND